MDKVTHRSELPAEPAEFRYMYTQVNLALERRKYLKLTGVLTLPRSSQNSKRKALYSLK